jgi:hypothetical protein
MRWGQSLENWRNCYWHDKNLTIFENSLPQCNISFAIIVWFIPYGLPSDWTRDSIVRSWQLTSRVLALTQLKIPKVLWCTLCTFLHLPCVFHEDSPSVCFHLPQRDCSYPSRCILGLDMNLTTILTVFMIFFSSLIEIPVKVPQIISQSQLFYLPWLLCKAFP